ncbi:hypothetical protein KGA66_16720 [Actinocrinis puniceicyclus]|uniref:Uncharacterized protein n=1 Tax=Actinocrinis puniceicyclus TaxID=977794 RepID=A0A8J8BCY9_9ACTN|nr:hypothetical protein [Actinocrinis puniceicyclus]MBS2964703.1 hypothetical protein [Actinocrinis puniceicyclus]
MDTEGVVRTDGTAMRQEMPPRTPAPDAPDLFAAVPEPEPTGHPDVDAALERLRELPELQTGAHPELYDGIHQRLQDALAQIDRQDAAS